MNKENLTVLVFKDNSVARTFRVPINWISKIGLLAGAISAIAMLGAFLSIRFYIESRQLMRASDPGYIRELEGENSTLKASLKQAQTKASEIAVVTPLASQLPITQSSSRSDGPAALESPSISTAMTAETTPPNTTEAPPPNPGGPPIPVGATSEPAGPVFTALPSVISSTVASNSPITVFGPKVKWSGKTLKVQFFIQYTKEDKGNQQGRIILLARGGETILAYPMSVLNTADGKSLIEPSKGEYFSVSRIREVKADFGPVRTNKALSTIEVFLISSENQLLVHQFLNPGQP